MPERHAPPRRRSRIVPLVGIAAALAAPARARAQDEPAATQVLGAGQEPIVAAMLGEGSLPGGCAWEDARVERDRVHVTYRCDTGPRALDLVHPSVAPEAAPRSDRFAVVSAAPLPERFAAALVERLRRGEARVLWSRVAPARASSPDGGPSGADDGTRDGAAGSTRLPGPTSPEPVTEESRSAGPALTPIVLGAVGALLALGLVAATLRRRLQRGARIVPAATVQRGRHAYLIGLLGALALALCLRFALLAFGEAIRIRLLGVPAPALSRALVAALGWSLGISASALMLSLAPRARVAALATLSALALVLAPAAVAQRRGDDTPRLGRVALLASSQTWVEDHPLRPPVTYRSNARGLRGEAIAALPASGTLRLCLVGDSYVFGSGVDEEGTLSRVVAAELARRRPERRIEVVNLGLPGDNLASHVDLLEPARAELGCAVLVVGLTLPNDLSRWDDQEDRRAVRRPGLFAAATLLLGRSAARALWTDALLERTVTARGVAHLDEQLARVDALVTGSRARVGFFAYAAYPDIAVRFARHPDIPFVMPERVDPADYIAGDGHPTAQGNLRFGRLVIELVDRLDPVDRPPSAAPSP